MNTLFLFIASFSMTAQGAVLPANLTKIFSYQCEATFLEGEGAAADYLNCTPFQQIGLLNARYNHYISDIRKKAGDEFYPESVCGLQVLRTRCTPSEPELRFGLALAPDETFSVPVNLSPGPGQAPELQGYASAAVKGKCADGLQLVHAYKAVPKSISRPLPTSFVNSNGRLDDILVLPPQKRTPRFEVTRQRNNEACDEAGDCISARFDQPVGFHRFDYKAISSVCVVPKASVPAGAAEFP